MSCSPHSSISQTMPSDYVQVTNFHNVSVTVQPRLPLGPAAVIAKSVWRLDHGLYSGKRVRFPAGALSLSVVYRGSFQGCEVSRLWSGPLSCMRDRCGCTCTPRRVLKACCFMKHMGNFTFVNVFHLPIPNIFIACIVFHIPLLPILQLTFFICQICWSPADRVTTRFWIEGLVHLKESSFRTTLHPAFESP